jgi:regulator of protease activity HflC (stomatin/prohibitin superfamily)
MKNFLTISLACISFSCSYNSDRTSSNQLTTNGFDILFTVLDNESNELNIGIRSNISLTNRTESNLEQEHQSNYKDNLLVPIVQRIVRTNLEQYSAGEIYNYKRPEIEQKIIEQTKSAFDSIDVELTKLFITTVKVPDELMRRLEKEHVEMLENKK